MRLSSGEGGSPEVDAQTMARLILIPEAARRSGYSDQTIRRWISQGLLKSYQSGPRRLMVDADELESLLMPAEVVTK